MNVAFWLEIHELSPLIKKYDLGLEVQFFAIPDLLDNYKDHIEELKRDIKDVKNIAFHGPYSELVPASRDHLIREVAFKRFSKAYEIAKELGAKNFILHSGFIPKTYRSEDWVKNSLEFWTEFLDGKDDMEIHIENVYEDDYDLMLQLVEKINKPNFSICLDIGHVNSNSSKSLEYWIKGLGDKIGYVHLHNNDGILDNHYGLHHGVIDIKNTLELLKKYSPWAKWSIESGEIFESVNWLEENGFLLAL